MLKIYNTLTKKIEEFVPRDPQMVTIYCCGPTVYHFATIANFRTYMMTDFLVRILRYEGFSVKFVMNITDVGHMTSDGDSGEDKMEKGAKREGKTAWEIAKYYTDIFLEDSKKLNLLDPDVRPKPTEHIKEQLAMVEILFTKGLAYKISDGIYFDTSKFPSYGALTGQSVEAMKAGARVEINPEKRNPNDFALWKFSPEGKKRDMEWESPWGKGFPGWHIECSAMSSKYLGNQIDMHTGGMDLIPIHHTNEIAQSEGAFCVSPFVRYWVHGQFVLIDGERMGKSKNNFYTLSDLEKKGYEALSLRYLYCTAQYRAYLNITWDALGNAQNSLKELRRLMQSFGNDKGRTSVSEEKLEKLDAFRNKFITAIENDINMPQALAIVWEVAKSNIPSRDKYELILDFDRVLGLGLANYELKITNDELQISEKIQELVKKRNTLRKEKKFQEADDVRNTIEEKGYTLEDSGEETIVRKK